MSEMNFEQLISETVSKQLSGGVVEKIIAEKLEKGISEALEGVFSYSGKGRELLKKKIEEVMVPVIEKNDFNAYIIKLDDCLTDIVNHTNLIDNKKILENFKELMKEPEVKEVKLSEIFEQFCKHVADNVETYGLEANCEDGEPYYECVDACMEVEHEDKKWRNSDYDDSYVNFTCEKDDKLNCRIKLYKNKENDKWNILDATKYMDINSLRTASDFEIYISKIRRAFVKIVMDEEDMSEEVEPTEKPEWDLR